MVSCTKSFFTVRIQNSGSIICNFGDRCLFPLRYLAKGCTVSKVNGGFILPLNRQKGRVIIKIIKITLAILLFVPSVSIGIILKAFAFIQLPIRELNQEFCRVYNKKREGNELFIENAENQKYIFLGDRKVFNPRGKDVRWVKKILDKSENISLEGFGKEAIESIISMKNDWSSVKSLNLNYTEVDNEVYDSIVNKGVRKEGITVIGCPEILAPFWEEGATQINLSGVESVTDRLIDKLVDECVNVTSINLSECTEITDVGLMAIVALYSESLTELLIDGCTGITVEGVKSVIENCKHLESLNLNGWSELFLERPNVESFFFSLSEFDSIKNLDLGMTDLRIQPRYLTNFKVFNQLKSLNLAGVKGFKEDMLLRLVEQLTNVEKLILTNVEGVTKNVLEAISRHCKEIKELNIKGCSKITAKNIGEFVQNCKKLSTPFKKIAF